MATGCVRRSKEQELVCLVARELGEIEVLEQRNSVAQEEQVVDALLRHRSANLHAARVAADEPDVPLDEPIGHLDADAG